MEFSNTPKIEMPKKIRSNSIVIFAFVLSFLIFLVSLYFYINIPKMGKAVGGGLGNLTGVAIGSLNAANDAKDAIEAGAEEGRSAKDTKVVIDGIAQATGNLQILRASVKFENIQESKNYTKLTTKFGDCIFTVDLAKYEYDEKNNIITIPDVKVKVVFDEEKTKDIAEYNGTGIITDAKDGMDGYINSEIETQEKAENEVENNELIMNEAREEAKKQVSNLVFAITGKDINIVIDKKEGGSNE